MKRYTVIITLLSLLFTSCLKDESDNPTYEEVLTDVYVSFKNFYANFEHRPDFDSLYVVTSASVNNDLTEDEFFHLLSKFVAGLEDPHLILENDDSLFSSFDLISPPKNINKQIIAQYYIAEGFETNDQCTYGLLSNNIGYLYLPDFLNDTSYNELPKEVFNGMMYLINTDGLVIDLRENIGGQGYFAKELLGYFTTTKTFWFSSENRTKNGFDTKYDWYIEPDETYHYNKDVVVLSSRATVSAAERFLLGAKVLPQMHIVGMRSAGTQGGVMGRETLNGWQYTITFERVFSANGVNYDYVGIPPDVKILDSVESFPVNQDPLLEEALSILQ